MSTVEERIDVAVPAEVAWACLHRVEDYPRFVDGVSGARPEGRHRARLALRTGGGAQECGAEIADRAQGSMMLWQTTQGARLRGAFAVRPIDGDHTRVQVRVEYDPAEISESFGGPRGFAQSDAIQQLVRHDLERFKELLEHPG